MLLNPAQQAAVEHRGGPLLVLAGAGTGKTRVITHRVASLLGDGVEPWQILAVTFTNKAAAEMRERIALICEDDAQVRKLWVGTFHSICARILRRYGEPIGLGPHFAIYDSADQLSVMKRAFKELNIGSHSVTPQAVLGHLDKVKNKGMGAEGLDTLPLEEPVRSIVRRTGRRYEDLVRRAGAADFGDLLVLTVKLLESADVENAPWRAPGGGPLEPRRPAKMMPPETGPSGQDSQTSLPLSPFAQGLASMIDFSAPTPPAPPPPLGRQLADLDPVVGLRRRFRQIVVDEFQDTNPVQARLIDLLGTRAELCVVGDDDQSIYGWRGADVAQILRFPDKHPGCQVIRLEQNYRSTTTILAAANALIRRNRGRFGKELFSELGEGEPVRLLTMHDEADEARWIARAIENDMAEGVAPDEIAVFYRTHAQSRALEEALVRARVRYSIYGGLRFFERREIKDLLAYLRLVVNPQSDVDLERIINVPARGLGKTSVDRLIAHAGGRGISLYDALDEADAAGLGAAAIKRVQGFKAMMEGIRATVGERDLGDVADEILDATEYRRILAEDGSDESRDRLENLQEFVGELSRFSEAEPEATLADYLEQVALLGDADGDGEGTGAVTMMTIHSAKGLEFAHVYLTGMEERVFPHARVLDDPEQIEEERRLAYVAVTRAKKRLTITWAQARRLYGTPQVGVLSRFVRELPPDALAGRASALTERVSTSAHGSRAPTMAPAEPAWDSDIVYDDDEAPRPARGRRGPDASAPASVDAGESIAVYIGMRVRHPRFGEGEVLSWTGAGSDLRLSLRFGLQGVKTILARYCEPV
ncbi:MAG: 3'-5' exonuclease [Nannocystaceae bacterium]